MRKHSYQHFINIPKVINLFFQYLINKDFYNYQLNNLA